MSSHFDYLRKVHERALDHAAGLVRAVAANDHDFIRAYAARVCLPQSAVRLVLSRCIARDLRADLRRDEVTVCIACRNDRVRLDIKTVSLRDAAAFAGWVKRETRKLIAIDTGRLYSDELRARRHARVMAKLRKATRAQVIALADKAEGKMAAEHVNSES